MGFVDNLKSYLSTGTPSLQDSGRYQGTRALEPLPAGRTSVDKQKNVLTPTKVVVAPSDHESAWRFADIDTNYLDHYTPNQLIRMLIDLSPEVSRALWDFQRLFNPGYEYRVYEIGSDKREHRRGKKHVDAVVAKIRDQYGSFDVLINRYSIGAFVAGAFCGEVVLDGAARETVDMVAPDPCSIRFRKVQDPVRGQVWQPGQMQGGEFVPLDIPTFRYIPIDPAPASPYGRSLISPALFTAIFLLSLMHDIKRVVMQQGYKRINISLDTQDAIDAYNFDSQGFASFSAYVKAAINEVKTAYSSLQPDDAFIHTDIFQIDDNVGTVDSASMEGIANIIEHLEKMVTRALKSNGLVMGTDNSSNELDSNRRWEIHAAGIKSLQHLCENMLEAFFTVSLQAVGIQAQVVFRFAELRASEMLRDQQTLQLQIQNAREMYKAGFVSQDEASNKAVGHDADVPEPRDEEVATETVQDNSSGEENLPMNNDDRINELIHQRLYEIFGFDKDGIDTGHKFTISSQWGINGNSKAA